MFSKLKRWYDRFCFIKQLCFDFIQRNFISNRKSLKLQYLDWLLERNSHPSDQYVPITEDGITFNDNMTKLIAFYLPQYYENDVNNKFFGKGFMEWYNVTKTLPQYIGHNQPQLPIDVGFYDLTHDDIMYRQIELAKKYGIYGFCFYYYWFSGERLLDKPLDNFLANKDLKMPFCLFWANETWTNLWGNGDHKTVIKEQKLLDDDNRKFANDILKYFQDERYIKINNKPVLIIYKTSAFEKNKFIDFLQKIKSEIIKAGFDGVYLMATDADLGKFDIKEYGFESVVEFCHTNVINNAPTLNVNNLYINPRFKAKILDIKKALQKKLHLIPVKNCFKCVCAGWDNSARKAYSIGSTVLQMSIDDYKKWLKDSVLLTKESNDKEEQYVFIDSWNEWAEGAHLEPDQNYGYAYLQATKEVLEETSIY